MRVCGRTGGEQAREACEDSADSSWEASRVWVRQGGEEGVERGQSGYEGPSGCREPSECAG
jgi:hypothetical protein